MSKKPNVIVIYADDLGYGDLSCYGAQDVQTPNVDKLLDDGIKFNSGYSTSAVCTPARYSLLTGEYPFRNAETMILPGDARCIIAKEQMTLPKIFKQADYSTAVVGKWHLGMGDGKIDWNNHISHSPNDVGFDYSFVFPGTNDRTPCVYVENGDVVNLDPNDPIEVSYTQECPYEDIPTYQKNPEMLRMQSSHGHNHSIVNGVGRIGFMRGGKKATWKDEDLAETFLGKLKGFIDDNAEKPFFAFYALHQPHVPRIPNPKFVGSTNLGPRGDVIAELDWCVGELRSHLEAKGLLEDTIIIFSSDNGPVLNDGYYDNSVELCFRHKPAGPLRGGKYSKFDGGARVPFIISWKNHLTAGTSDALISHVDLSASFASMLNVELHDGEVPDSENLCDLITGKSGKGRDEVMFESINKAMVLRQGKWEYLSPSAGAWISPQTKNELGNSMDKLFYNMQYDIGQKENIYHNYSEIADKMAARIDTILASKQTR
ncbi:MAG: sulfatase-like hydrolase/transferase [Clostridia bacterium]